MPTIVRTCRDLGFAGLREFMLALAQELAVGGSPLHRRVQHRGRGRRRGRQDRAQRRGLGDRACAASSTWRCSTARSAAIAAAPHVDCYGAGATSWFMASDLQARLFRLGLLGQRLVRLPPAAGGGRHAAPGRRGHRDLARGRHALTARRGRHRARAGRHGGRADAARHAAGARAPTSLLGLSVPEDAVMHVGTEAYLAHLTVIEILTVLAGAEPRRPAVQRAAACTRGACTAHGIDSAARIRCRAGTAEARERMAETTQRHLLEGGLVVDGCGGPGWPGDVLLVGDRIVARRRRPAPALARRLAAADVDSRSTAAAR